MAESSAVIDKIMESIDDTLNKLKKAKTAEETKIYSEAVSNLTKSFESFSDAIININSDLDDYDFEDEEDDFNEEEFLKLLENSPLNQKKK